MRRILTGRPRLVLVPLTGLALACVAAACVVVVYRSGAADQQARLSLAAVEDELDGVQALPWRPGDRAAARRELARTARAVSMRLDALLASAPPPSLRRAPAAIRANLATLDALVAPRPTRPIGKLAAAQQRTLAAVRRVLAAADGVYAGRSNVARWLSRVGFLGAIFGLLGGFLFYFRRSERTRDRLATRAATDALTGLGNRSALSDALASPRGAAEDGSRAILYVDLDDFKDANDAYGHRGGDIVLREVAARLTRHTRGDDVCIRLGGDEFAVFLSGADEQAALHSADRIAAELREPIRVGRGVARVTASIGVASASVVVDLETLLHRADVAMYAAKAAGEGRVELFTPHLLDGGTPDASDGASVPAASPARGAALPSEA